MTDKFIVPSIDSRLGGLIEVSRRVKNEADKADKKVVKQTITIRCQQSG